MIINLRGEYKKLTSWYIKSIHVSLKNNLKNTVIRKEMIIRVPRI